MEKRVKPFKVNVKFSINKPMIVPPLDWINAKEGGYYTTEMQRKSPLSRHHDVIPQSVLDAVNKIQAVPFTISPEGLEILNTLSKVKRAQIKELKQQIKAIKAQLLEVDLTPEA
jgi:DNA-directed RNA polymerase